MRVVLAALLLAAAAATRAGGEARPSSPAPPSSLVRFDADVAPILSRCRPCHYPGGVMHERLPFDDEATVRKTGEKLFTRIKDEKQRAVLRRFFAVAHSGERGGGSP